MAFDPDKYLTEKSVWGDIVKPIGRGLIQTIDRVSAAPLRGAVEGIQNYEPEGNGSFHPGVLGSMLKGAGRGFMYPDQVQSAQQAYARMGVSDIPTPRMKQVNGNWVPGIPDNERSRDAQGNFNSPDQGVSPSQAAVLGGIQDALAPAPGVGIVAKAVGNIVGSAKDASASLIGFSANKIQDQIKALKSARTPGEAAFYSKSLQRMGVNAEDIKAVPSFSENQKLPLSPYRDPSLPNAPIWRSFETPKTIQDIASFDKNPIKPGLTRQESESMNYQMLKDMVNGDREIPRDPQAYADFLAESHDYGKPIKRKFDPLDAMMDPPSTSSGGVPGYEDMMPPEYLASKVKYEQETREAIGRQSRPTRIPKDKSSPIGVRIIDPSTLPLRPRSSKVDVRQNDFPKLQESDQIKSVLNKYEAGRRPLVVNQEKIDALKKLLKQDLPMEKKKEIGKLIFAENMKIKLPSLNEYESSIK